MAAAVIVCLRFRRSRRRPMPACCRRTRQTVRRWRMLPSSWCSSFPRNSTCRRRRWPCHSGRWHCGASAAVGGRKPSDPRRGLPRTGYLHVLVSYRVADGHPVENSIEFTVNSVPEGQEPVVTQTDDASHQTIPHPISDSGVGWGTVGLIAVGALVVVGGAVFLVTRRSRRRA